jgi:hypothetical protein
MKPEACRGEEPAMAAPIIPAIDQHVANAGGAHFAKGNFLRVVVRGHGRIIKNPDPPHEFRRMGRNDRGRLAYGWRRRVLAPSGFARRQGRPWPYEDGSTSEGWGALPCAPGNEKPGTRG